MLRKLTLPLLISLASCGEDLKLNPQNNNLKDANIVLTSEQEKEVDDFWYKHRNPNIPNLCKRDNIVEATNDFVFSWLPRLEEKYTVEIAKVIAARIVKEVYFCLSDLAIKTLDQRYSQGIANKYRKYSENFLFDLNLNGKIDNEDLQFPKYYVFSGGYYVLQKPIAISVNDLEMLKSSAHVYPVSQQFLNLNIPVSDRTEFVKASNLFWKVDDPTPSSEWKRLTAAGFGSLTLGTMETNENVTSADAVSDIFENPSKYKLTSFAAAYFIHHKAYLDLVGKEKFNQKYPKISIYLRTKVANNYLNDNEFTRFKERLRPGDIVKSKKERMDITIGEDYVDRWAIYVKKDDFLTFDDNFSERHMWAVMSFNNFSLNASDGFQ